MKLVSPVIRAAAIALPLARVIVVIGASGLLLAAGNVSDTRPTVATSVADPVFQPLSAVTPADTAPDQPQAGAAAPASAMAALAVIAAQSRVLEAQAKVFEAQPAIVEAQPASLSSLVASIGDADTAVAGDRDLHCLATAVYFESRGEPLEGQLAVAQAILNRVESGRYAETACRVIDQPGQFNFRRSGAPRAGEAWRAAKSIAVIAMRDLWREVAPDSMSFHASYVAPNWRAKAKVVRIGRHIFYR